MSAISLDSPVRLRLAYSAGAVACAGSALAFTLAARIAIGPGSLGYDAAWSLIWGRQLAHGELPDLTVPYAPTPHPLSNALALLLAPFGPAFGASAIMLLSWCCLLALAWGVARLGTVLFAWPVGVLAALIVTTRAGVLSMTGSAVVDLPFLALVVWAAVLEAQRARRGTPVLVLLATAGLLRPEAWLLAAGYALWMLPRQDPRQRPATLALAASAPLIWATADLLLTGDPLFSLHGTQQLAAQIGRPRSLPTAIDLTPHYLRVALGPAVAPLALLGVLLAVWARRRALPLPSAMVVFGLLTFAALGVADLPLLPRYLLLPTVMLVLSAAVAVLGWTALDEGDSRRRTWRVVGLAAALWLLLGAAGDVDRMLGRGAFFEARNAQRAELRAALDDPAAIAAARRCEVLAGSGFDRPLMILWTDSTPERVRTWPDASVSSALLFAREVPRRGAWRVVTRQGRVTARASGC